MEFNNILLTQTVIGCIRLMPCYDIYKIQKDRMSDPFSLCLAAKIRGYHQARRTQIDVAGFFAVDKDHRIS